MLMQFPVISVTLRRTWPGAVWPGFTKDPATQQRGVLGLLLSRYDAGESLTILFFFKTNYWHRSRIRAEWLRLSGHVPVISRKMRKCEKQMGGLSFQHA